MAIDFEVRHWKACGRGGEVAVAMQRMAWKKGNWDWTGHLPWHCSQEQ